MAALVLLSTSVHAYFMTLDANEEQCFFDKLTTGTKMEVSYEVAEGGFLDIGFKVRHCISISPAKKNLL